MTSQELLPILDKLALADIPADLTGLLRELTAAQSRLQAKRALFLEMVQAEARFATEVEHTKTLARQIGNDALKYPSRKIWEGVSIESKRVAFAKSEGFSYLPKLTRRWWKISRQTTKISCAPTLWIRFQECSTAGAV